MSFWEKIQKDIKKNIKEGLTIVKEGSAVVSQKTRLIAERVGELTDEGKRKYKLITLNMKVQDEFARLGGKVYDLNFKTKDPMSNKRVISIISKIKKLEDQITVLEKKRGKRTVRSGAKKIRRKSTRLK